MSKPKPVNYRKIAYQRHCYEQLEQHLAEREMQLNHKEFLLDLAALTDFLEEENYIGAHYLGSVLLERLKSKVPEWHKKMCRHIDSKFQVPDIQLDPEQAE